MGVFLIGNGKDLFLSPFLNMGMRVSLGIIGFLLFQVVLIMWAMIRFGASKKKALIMWIPLFFILTVLAGLRFIRPGVPPGIGVQDGRLADCPTSPNCVCSLSDSPSHLIDPVKYPGGNVDVRAQLKTVFEKERGWIWVTETQDYWHLEFRTRWMAYVDDVEFLFDDQTGIIHVRSASRLGYSDMGANRARIEGLREKLAAEL